MEHEIPDYVETIWDRMVAAFINIDPDRNDQPIHEYLDGEENGEHYYEDQV